MSRDAGATGRTEASPPGRSSTPSVAAAGVNECPVPVILTLSPSAAALATSLATSAVDVGAATREGAAVTLRAQFCQEGAFWLVIGEDPPTVRLSASILPARRRARS